MQNSEVTFVVRLKQHGNGAQSPIAQSSRKFPSQPGYLIYAEIQCRTAASPFFWQGAGFWWHPGSCSSSIMAALRPTDSTEMVQQRDFQKQEQELDG